MQHKRWNKHKRRRSHPIVVFLAATPLTPAQQMRVNSKQEHKNLAAVRSCPPCNKAPRAQRGLSLCLPGMTLIGSSLCLYLCLPLREEKEDEHLPSQTGYAKLGGENRLTGGKNAISVTTEANMEMVSLKRDLS